MVSARKISLSGLGDSLTGVVPYSYKENRVAQHLEHVLFDNMDRITQITHGTPKILFDSRGMAEAILASDWMKRERARIWNEGFDAGELDTISHQSWNEECTANPYGELCHCGEWVAAISQPGVESNPNMVDAFCPDCISVRCDAFPGACKKGEFA